MKWSRMRTLRAIFLIVALSNVLLSGSFSGVVSPSPDSTTEGTVRLEVNDVGRPALIQDERSRTDRRWLHNLEPNQDTTFHSRHLTQRSSSQRNRGEFGSSLNCSEIEEFLNVSTRTWNVNDDLLRNINNSIQAIVNCSAENDIILFNTSVLLQPPTSIIIPWNITLGAYGGDFLVEDGTIAKATSKAKLKCPEQGDLLILRGGSVTISNIVFMHCKRRGSIINMDYDECEDRQERAYVQLRDVEFRDNLLHEHYWIVAANNPNCAQLRMENVVLSKNQCNRRGCVSLASVNHLSNVHIVGNLLDTRVTSATTVLLASEGSHTIAVNISALKNEIRIFRLDNSTLLVSDSQFQNNTIASSPFEMDEVLGGSAVLANLSWVSIVNSVFEGNVGRNGGALYASACQINVTKCEFRRNDASKGSGGAVFALNGSSLHFTSCTFSRNIGRRGGCIDVQQKSQLRMEMGRVEANHAFMDAGAISINDSVADFSGTSFLRNNARGDGSVILGYRSTLSFASVKIGANKARLAGAIHLNSSSAVFRNVRFQANEAGSHGGGILSSNSTVRVRESTFLSNRGADGGSIGVRSQSILHVIASTFSNNTVGYWGGAIHADQRSRVVLKALEFSNNIAGRRGGACFFNGTDVRITSVNFKGNNASNRGGALFGHSGSMTVSLSTFLQNKANSGGGLFLEDINNVSFDSVTLERNSANNTGGAVVLVKAHGNVSFSGCHFSRNEAGEGGGVYLDGSNMTMQHCVLSSNKATRYAGVCLVKKSQLKSTNAFVVSNNALEIGGGMGVISGSSLYCKKCVLKRNMAGYGGGLYADADDSIPIVVQFYNSTVEGNNASIHGGGVAFRRGNDASDDCWNLEASCGRLLFLNTNFVGNHARFNGTAILTTGKGVISYCQYTRAVRGFITRWHLSTLLALRPSETCGSWPKDSRRNRHDGSLLTFYRMVLVFSTGADDEATVEDNKDSTPILHNGRRRTQLASLGVKVRDTFGNDPLPTVLDGIELTMSSSHHYFRYPVRIPLERGIGRFENVTGFLPPGNYTLVIHSNSRILEQGSLILHLRECQIGEEPTAGQERCQRCANVSYNFDPTKPRGCTACPKDATCEGRYIVPKPGYWHKSPCHKNVQHCLNDKACHESERQSKLANSTANFTDCNMTSDNRTAYQTALCRKGYRGLLCGSCQSGYGLSLSFLCLKCPKVVESLSTILCLILYLLIMASFTIRGSLPKGPAIRRTLPSSSLNSSISGNSSRSAAVSIQVAKATRNGINPPRVIQTQPQANTSKAPNNQQSYLETTRWETTEIFKILINSLQVTAIAAGIHVQWTEAMIEMFEASEYVGALTSAAVSRPIDCLIDTDSSAMRSVWRTLLSLFVPGAVMALFALFWACVALYGKESRSYFWKRTLLSVIAITYISYLGLTKYAVRAFYCVEVYNSENPFSNSKSKYWAVDTSIQCYTRNHFGLIAIAVIVLVFISMSFPLISAIVLSRDKVQHQQNPGWTFEVMGFLYRAFKERFVFWESVVMLRKGFLSIIVVFAYPLGGESQGLLAIIVLVLSLFAHLKCLPYKEEFNRLNSYEAGSLLVSCLTFVLGQFFGVEKSVEFIRRLASVLIISINVSFFLFLVSVLFLSWLEHCKAVLISEGAQIDENAPPWKVLKVFLAAKAANCCQSS